VQNDKLKFKDEFAGKAETKVTEVTNIPATSTPTLKGKE